MLLLAASTVPRPIAIIAIVIISKTTKAMRWVVLTKRRATSTYKHACVSVPRGRNVTTYPCAVPYLWEFVRGAWWVSRRENARQSEYKKTRERGTNIKDSPGPTQVYWRR